MLKYGEYIIRRWGEFSDFNDIKKYKKSIEQYQKELNECINEEVLKITETLKELDNKSKTENK